MGGIPVIGDLVKATKAPKPAPVQAAPLPPAEDPDMGKKRDEEALKAAQRAAAGGRASTMLTSPLGAVGGVSGAENLSKYLLG